MKIKILVIGGVAGGASFAARARRLSEEAEIIVFEKSGYVSFANCGLPYHIGGEIEKREKLLLQSPSSLKARFNLDVRVRSEVTKINPADKNIEVLELDTGNIYIEKYDHLIFAPGASPIKPKLEGISAEGIFTLRNIEDMDQILDWMKKMSPQHATIVGGGFIGLELLEQLHRKVPNLTIIEAANQLLAPLDPEMTTVLQKELFRNSVSVILGDSLAKFEEPLTAVTASGRRIKTDLVILAIGVRPEVSLARDCGIQIGSKGGVKVNKYMQTSLPSIWALGDVAEIENIVTRESGLMPMAGLANRQGRVVADNILGSSKREFAGGQGTAILRVFDLTAAVTGANEKTLKALEKPFQSILLFPQSHAGYYPGASELTIKLIFCPVSRLILGAQVIGKEGVDKRIDVFATAIKAKMTIDELSELELSYSPPFGSAKDPVNMAGMIGKNILDGLVDSINVQEFLQSKENFFILDVRDKSEIERGAIEGHYWIPLPELRNRMQEIPKDKPILVYCQSSQRSYYAARILVQSGFKVKNLSGAYKAWVLNQSLQEVGHNIL